GLLSRGPASRSKPSRRERVFGRALSADGPCRGCAPPIGEARSSLRLRLRGARRTCRLDRSGEQLSVLKSVARPSRKRGPLLFALLLAACATASQERSAPALREQIWTQTTPTLAHDLAFGPSECLREPQDAEARQSVEIGRALFRSPALLG